MRKAVPTAITITAVHSLILCIYMRIIYITLKLTIEANMLTHSEISNFNKYGFLIKRKYLAESCLDEMQHVAVNHLENHISPIEFEADLKYPGAPDSSDAPGGKTPRRLLQAYARDLSFQRWAKNHTLGENLRQLFATKNDLFLSQCHHNCVMTKAKTYSSATLWHQDNRYWSFEEENLISVWLALGDENKKNGCLYVIPGSHHLEIHPERFNKALFLRIMMCKMSYLLKMQKQLNYKKETFFFFIVSYFMLQEEIIPAELNYLWFLLFMNLEIIQLTGHVQQNSHQYKSVEHQNQIN